MPKHRATAPQRRPFAPFDSHNRPGAKRHDDHDAAPHASSPADSSPTPDTVESSVESASQQQPIDSLPRRIVAYLRRNIVHMTVNAGIAVWLFSLFASNWPSMIGSNVPLQWAYTLLASFIALGAALPIAGGVLVTALCAASVVMFWKNGMSPFISYVMTWPIAWSMGLLAKRAKPAVSVPCVVIVCLSYIIPRRHYLLDAGLMFPDYDCVVMCLAAYAAGYALRLNERLRRQAQTEREMTQLRADSQALRHMRHDAALQRMIHDTVTGELTYIALITRPSYRPAELAESSTDIGSDRGSQSPATAVTPSDPRIPIIHEHVMAALTATRQAIELLADRQSPTLDQPATPAEALPQTTSPSEPVSGNTPMPQDSLTRFAQRHDRDLHALGFRGETTIIHAGLPQHTNTNASTTSDTELDDDLRALLGELYANIAAHGQSDGGWYAMTITVGGHELRVRCENDIAPQREMDAALSSGTGLDRQRAAVAQCGGSLDTFRDHGVFSIFVELPR